jgi:YNFM family putative membrane transporter
MNNSLVQNDGTEDVASGRIRRGTPAYVRMSVALLIAGFATFALLYGTQPLLPMLAAEYHLGAAQASLAVSFSTGFMALAFIPASVLSDRLGRRPLMTASLFAAAGLTALSAILPGWGTLLLMRALTGAALAGIPAIAMTYVAEECDTTSLGAAMGLYIAGSAIGGMGGRVGVTLLTVAFGWRMALGILGLASLAGAAVFAAAAPASRGFTPIRHDLRSFLQATSRVLGDQALPWLYVEGFLLMGAFVTIYNYTGFRLLAPPFSLTQSQVGLIFLLYIVGSFSSAYVGGLAGRLGRRKVLWVLVAAMICGVALTALRPIMMILAGIGLITGAFFAAHSTASAWVGQRAGRDKAQASALYLLFYYLGSSTLGSVGGLAWTHGGWAGVTTFTLALTGAALIVALRLLNVTPAVPMAAAPSPGALRPS